VQGGGKAGSALGGLRWWQRPAGTGARNLLAQLLDLACRGSKLITDTGRRCGGRQGRLNLHPAPARLRHIPDVLVDGLADRRKEIFHSRFCSHGAHPETDHKL
jgi:hypothetical protein